MVSKIIVYTDHKNLIFQMFSVQRILQWRLFVDLFDCCLRYIPGHKIVLANCFSRLSLIKKPSAGVKDQKGLTCLIYFKIKIPKDKEEILECKTFLNIAWETFINIIKQRNNELFYKELDKCWLNNPPLETMKNPIIINNIVNYQWTDSPLQRKIISHPNCWLSNTQDHLNSSMTMEVNLLDGIFKNS